MSSDRLARLAQRMALATLALTVLMLVLNAAAWLVPGLAGSDGAGLAFSLSNSLLAQAAVDPQHFPWWQQLGAVLLSSVPLLVLTYGLMHLRALFGGYARGEYFAPTAASHMEATGRSVAYWVLANTLCEPLLSAWTTMNAPVGQRFVSVSIESSAIVALFLAGCVIVIARVLSRASELDRENRQFV